MSARRLRPSWSFLAVLTTAAGLTLVGASPAGDLERIRREREVAGQKTVSEVRGLLAEARQLETKNPSEARSRLLRALSLVENARGLSATQQADLHTRLLMYTADAVRGFIDDVARVGRGDDVAVMIFTEFGRRVEENGSLGTDHGTATPMFLVGRGVKGGFYGRHPSLTDLDDGNMKMTTDFRRVYATAIKEWLGYDQTQAVLKGTFAPMGVFA